MFPSVDPGEVGVTGLLWLFFSYGYVLFYASGLISEGSDLLLLVPSMAGLVGGVVLPLLGAVPDGAIMLFSGLGDISTAQETLSVGVGALAGSTIMLLTVPWAMSVFNGKVDLVGENKIPNYRGKPKLSSKSLLDTGVGLSDEIKHGGTMMMVTTIPYFVIQIPASFLHGPSEEVAAGEKYYALSGLIVCLVFFVAYLWLQMHISKEGTDRMKRVAIMKKKLEQGIVSLSGVMAEIIKREEGGAVSDGVKYGAVESGPPAEVQTILKEILRDPFNKYDANGNGTLDRKEVRIFFRDLNENISQAEMDALFEKCDKDGSGAICFDEFVVACFYFIKSHGAEAVVGQEIVVKPDLEKAGTKATIFEGGEDDDEEEEMPEDITDLSPEKQQTIIKRRAFTMLFIGTALVVIFSDPMVDVMQEIAVRAHLSPFYVSFILAPLASNASEVLASQYYAKKKTSKTISVSLTALEGAASMNNTFCLSIFMGLIFCRGLAWQYTAETISIILVQFIIGFLVQKSTMNTLTACFVLAVFPLSIALVAGLEAIGFD